MIAMVMRVVACRFLLSAVDTRSIVASSTVRTRSLRPTTRTRVPGRRPSGRRGRARFAFDLNPPPLPASPPPAFGPYERFLAGDDAPAWARRIIKCQQDEESGGHDGCSRRQEAATGRTPARPAEHHDRARCERDEAAGADTPKEPIKTSATMRPSRAARAQRPHSRWAAGSARERHKQTDPADEAGSDGPRIRGVP